MYGNDVIIIYSLVRQPRDVVWGRACPGGHPAACRNGCRRDPRPARLLGGVLLHGDVIWSWRLCLRAGVSTFRNVC
jgi:hypothetical protein